MYNALSIGHRYKGSTDQYLFYALKSLSIREELHDTNGIIYSLENMGNYYLEQENYKKAIQCFKTTYGFHKARGDIRGELIGLNNLGTVYHKKKDIDSALFFYEKGQKLINMHREFEKDAADIFSNYSYLLRLKRNYKELSNLEIK